MGGIVSHPSTPGCGDDEKKGMSIEVPGIVLSELSSDFVSLVSSRGVSSSSVERKPFRMGGYTSGVYGHR